MLKRKKITILSLIIFALSLLTRLGTLIFSTNIIIYFGIRFLDTVNTACLALMGISGVGTVFAIGAEVVNRINRFKQEALTNAETVTPKLNMTGKLDPIKVKQQLHESMAPWYKTNIEQHLCKSLEAQFDKMDAQQNRLHGLLENNGAIALGDTEDILDTVEQNMCKRIRNLINILSVYDPTVPDNHNIVADEISKCITENKSLLDSAQEFILAVANYLNTQNSSYDIDELNIYKNALLDEINKANTQD